MRLQARKNRKPCKQKRDAAGAQSQQPGLLDAQDQSEDEAGNAAELGAAEEFSTGGQTENVCPEELDLGLEEPTRDIGEEARQSTFRGNAKAWFAAKPHSRVWTLHAVISVQQHSQDQYFAQAGIAWERSEWLRRVDNPSTAPCHRVVRAAEGVFVDDAVSKYSALLQDPNEWSGMPVSHRTHKTAFQTFRSISSALCTKEQLEAVL